MTLFAIPSWWRARSGSVLWSLVAQACLELTDIPGVDSPSLAALYPTYVAVQAGMPYRLPGRWGPLANPSITPSGVAVVTLPGGDSAYVISGLRRGFAKWDPGVAGLHPVWIAVLDSARAAPILVGHHGVPSLAPENTLAGVNAACQLGLPGLEVDVRFSKDGVPVLMHDRDVRRTSNGTGNVDEMTFAQLEQLDVGSWFGPAFVGERIPTLVDFLGFSAQCGFDHIQLDMKSFVPLGVDSAMKWVGAAARATGISQRVFVASDLYSLGRGVSLVPGMHTLTYGGVVTPAFAAILIQYHIEAVGVFFGDYAASSGPLAHLDSAGVLVGVWSPPGVLSLDGLSPVPRFVTSDWGWRFVN